MKTEQEFENPLLKMSDTPDEQYVATPTGAASSMLKESIALPEVKAPLNEAAQIQAIRERNTNFVFLFGAPQRGKTVITSAIVNFLSGKEAQGQLDPFDVSKGGKDKGHALLQTLQRLFSEDKFPDRTAITGDDGPICVNIRFTPDDKVDSEALNFTFLEMLGDDLQRVDAPDGGRGDLPASINAYFKVKGVSISFILVTDYINASKDDQLINRFITHITGENPDFKNSRFLLLITKWDEYTGGLSVNDFVERNMRVTYGKLYHSKHSISDFSIGSVTTADGKPFLQEFNPKTAKRVINWLYTNITGKPLYRKSWFIKFIEKFQKYT